MATAYTKANDVEAGDNAFIVGEEDTLVGLSERSVRHGFIRKVFSILLIQLTVTFGIAALFAYNNTIGNWVKTVRGRAESLPAQSSEGTHGAPPRRSRPSSTPAS